MKKIFSVIISTSFLVSVIHAQVSVNTELKTIINQSFSYFPKIKEAENLVDISQQKLELSQVNNPVVDGNLSYNYVLPKIKLPFSINGEVKDIQFYPVHNVNGNISAGYTLFDFGRLKASLQKSKTDLKYSQDNVEQVKAQLASQVAGIYYGIMYLRKAVEIEDSTLAFLEENKAIAASRFKNGTGLKIDELALQSQMDAELNNKQDLLNNLQKQYNLLAYTANTTSVNSNGFDFSVLMNDTSALLSEALSLNPEIKLAVDKLDQAKADLDITKHNDKPLVTLGGSAGIKNGYLPDIGEMRPNLALGASLKIPIYSGGKTKRQIKINESLVKQNDLSIQSLQAQYKKDMQQTVNDIQTDIAKINNTASQIDNALAQKKLASTRYLNGVGTQLEITNAAVALQRIQLTKLLYQYQFCLANIELARLSGYAYWR